MNDDIKDIVEKGEYIKSYIYYDGPIFWISQYNYISYLYWHYDGAEEYSEYLIIPISYGQILEGEAGKLEAYDLFRNTKDLYRFREYHHGKKLSEYFKINNVKELKEENLPDKGINYFEFFSDVNEKYIKENNIA